MLTATSLGFNYPGIAERALANVSFSVEAGSVLGVVGHIGSGRTTLCMCLAGFVPRITGGASTGELSVAGVDPRRAEGHRMSRLVGMVFQDAAAQVTQVSVLGEVMAPLINRGMELREAESRSRDLLRYAGLGDVIGGVDARHKRTWELSGGQQQRMALAATLAIDPGVLVLDDATAVLDPRGKQEVGRMVGDLAGEKTLVVVDQVDFVAPIADHILVLTDGEACAFGPADDILRDAETLATAGVEPPMPVRVARAIGASVLPFTVEEFEHAVGAATGGSGNGLAADTSSQPDRGRPPVPVPNPPPTGSSEPAVRIEGAGFRYQDGTVALDTTSLEVGEGEIRAIIGGNGAGKTTLAKLVIGLIEPTDGKVIVDGVDTTQRHVATLAETVGAAFQNPDEQITERTVAQEIGFPLRLRQYERAGLFGKRQRYDDADIRDRVARACKSVGLDEDVLDRDPTLLAHGQRKLVTIAEALVSEPPILVLDEPAAGLDVGARRFLRRLFTELSQAGTALVLVEHDMDLVSEVAHTATVMSGGRAVLEGPPRTVFAPERHDYLADVQIEPPRAARLARRVSVDALTYDNLVAELLPAQEVR